MAFLTFHLIPPGSEPESIYQINEVGTGILCGFWGAFVDTGQRHKAFASHVTSLLAAGVHHLLVRTTEPSVDTPQRMLGMASAARELARLMRDTTVQPSAMLAWKLEQLPTPMAVAHPQG